MPPSEQTEELSQAQEFLTRMQTPEFTAAPEKILEQVQREMRRTEDFGICLPSLNDGRPPIITLTYEDESEAHFVLTGLQVAGPPY